jgi:hypothetical protein
MVGVAMAAVTATTPAVASRDNEMTGV